MPVDGVVLDSTMDTLETIVLLIFGWLLGLLTPPIAEAIRRRKDLSEIKRALLIELQELQFRLMATVYLIAKKMGQYDRTLLMWMKPILERYEGANRADRILQSITQGIALTDEQLKVIADHAAGNPNKGLQLKKFHAPLLDGKLGQLGAFDVQTQNVLFEIRTHLNIINEDIDQYRFYFNQTFNSGLSEQNRTLIRENIDGSYENIGQQARICADLIHKVLNTK